MLSEIVRGDKAFAQSLSAITNGSNFYDDNNSAIHNNFVQSGSWVPVAAVETVNSSRFTLKLDGGYVYNLASNWQIANETISNNAYHSWGLGGSFGWTHSSGFALSADYLYLAQGWQTSTQIGQNQQHVVTLTPAYRFSFGADNAWGLKIGLGVGASFGNATLNTTGKTAAGAYQTANPTPIKIATGAAYSKSGTTDLGDVLNNLIVTGGPIVFADNKGANSLTFTVTPNANQTINWDNKPITLDPYAVLSSLSIQTNNMITTNILSLGCTPTNQCFNDFVGYVAANNAKYITNSGMVAKDLWLGVLTSTNANAATAFKNLLTAATATNMEKLGAKEVAWVADAVWQGLEHGLSGTSTIEQQNTAKKFQIDAALAGTGSYIYYGNVKKADATIDGANVTGWKNWANNATYAVEFKNLLTAATAANMEKLGNKEVAWVADAVWQGLSAANGTGATDNAKKKSQIDALKGTGGYIFYGQVAKDGAAGIGWKNWLFDANKSVEFNNLYAAAGVSNLEKLANKEIMFISSQDLSRVQGDTDAIKKQKLIALNNQTVGEKSYIYFDQVNKDDDLINNTTGWKTFASDAQYQTEFKNLLNVAGTANMEKLSVGETITLPWQIWTSIQSGSSMQNKTILQALTSDGLGTGITFGKVTIADWKNLLSAEDYHLDTGKDILLNNLFNNIDASDSEHLPAGEVFLVSYSAYTNISTEGDGTIIENINARIRKLTGNDATIYYGSVTPQDLIPILTDETKADQLKKILDIVPTEKIDKITDADLAKNDLTKTNGKIKVPWQVWTGLSKGDPAANKAAIADLYKAPERLGVLLIREPVIEYEKVERSQWVNLVTAVNGTAEQSYDNFKNLLTNAGVNYFDKLGKDEVLYINDQILQKLDGTITEKNNC